MSHLVGNPEDRFSPDAAQIMNAASPQTKTDRCGTRTHNQRLRRTLLYPVELIGHTNETIDDPDLNHFLSSCAISSQEKNNDKKKKKKNIVLLLLVQCSHFLYSRVKHRTRLFIADNEVSYFLISFMK